VVRYETLRTHALDGQASGGRLGLALFQGKGMAAWLRVCADIAPVALPGSSRPGPMEPGSCQELVDVLATMALAALGG
jgi:hypothetical protein